VIRKAGMFAFFDSDRGKAVMAPVEPFYVNRFTVIRCALRYLPRG
jgi:hypothetical protein